MAERGMPQPGEIYRHFKDKLYQIITVATDSETGALMVVYQAMYGDFRSYVRPLDMFLSEVDHKKYPDVFQRYRFELYQGLPKTVPRTMMKTQSIENLGSTDIKSSASMVVSNPLQGKQSESRTVAGESLNVKQKAAVDYPVHNTQASYQTISKEKGLDEPVQLKSQVQAASEGDVNSILMDFLDADSYSKKLNIISANMKHLNDRLINDMAVSLDCAVEEGPLERRIQELIYCLKAMSRFEDKRLR